MAKAPTTEAPDQEASAQLATMYEDYVVLRAKATEAQDAADAKLLEINKFAAANGLGEDEPDLSDEDVPEEAA